MDGPFELLEGHEQVVYGSDADTGLRCIVAIHSTALGPSLGGTRFYEYDTEEAALVDVLRLSRAMSYKAACAGLDVGGGKAVIIGNPETDKSEPLLRAYGRVIASLGGRYITACDVGTYPQDMEVVSREAAPWVTGMDVAHGGSGDSGVTTAQGVFVALEAVADHLWGDASLTGRHVAVQGLGKVGARLCQHLAEAGAKLTVADIDEAAVERVADLGPEIVDVDDILEVDADILSPNALGAVLSKTTIPDLEVAAVCGGANNQLATLEDARRLQEHGVLYAPDYVVNAGGLIQVSDELHPDGYSPQRTLRKTEQIGVTLREIFRLADDLGETTEIAAERVAEHRMDAVSRLRRFHIPR